MGEKELVKDGLSVQPPGPRQRTERWPGTGQCSCHLQLCLWVCPGSRKPGHRGVLAEGLPALWSYFLFPGRFSSTEVVGKGREREWHSSRPADRMAEENSQSKVRRQRSLGEKQNKTKNWSLSFDVNQSLQVPSTGQRAPRAPRHTALSPLRCACPVPHSLCLLAACMQRLALASSALKTRRGKISAWVKHPSTNLCSIYIQYHFQPY